MAKKIKKLLALILVFSMMMSLLCVGAAAAGPLFCLEEEHNHETDECQLHEHSAACYEAACEKNETDPYCGKTVHAHGDGDCNTAAESCNNKAVHTHGDGNCICPAHVHGDGNCDTDACEKTVHTHGDGNCNSVCTQKDTEGHECSGACEMTDCTLEEHTHTAACCSQEAHSHGAECCTLEEHTHTAACCTLEEHAHSSEEGCYHIHTPWGEESTCYTKGICGFEQGKCELKEHAHTEADCYAADDDVAMVLGKGGYASLEEAVAAANANADADTIVLLNNITMDEKLTISSNVAINGNSKIITRADTYTGTMFEVANKGKLTLGGGVVFDGGNNWTFNSKGYYDDMKAGLTEDADSNNPRTYTASEVGGVVATAAMISISSGGSVVMNDATIQNNWTDRGKHNDGALFSVPAGAALTINDGALIKHARSSVVGQIKGTWTMNGGKIDDVFGENTNGGVMDIRGGTVYINGGEITNVRTLGLNKNGNGILAQVLGAASKLIINGGWIHGNSSFSPGGGWGAVLYTNEYGNIVMNGGVIEDNVTDHCSAFAHKHPVADQLNGGTMVVEPSLVAWFDSFFYGDVAVGNEMEIVGKDDALICMLGDTNYKLDIDGEINGGTIWVMYNQPVTGEGTITSDVQIKADPSYFETDGKVTFSESTKWLDSLITVDSIGSDAFLKVDSGVTIDGIQVRVLGSVPSGEYTNTTEAQTEQKSAYKQEAGATVKSPVLYFHRLTDDQKQNIVVTYDYNGGLDAQNWSGCQITSDESFVPTAPTPTKKGFKLAGWEYAENNDPESLSMGSEAAYAGEEIAESVRLIAVWTLDISEAPDDTVARKTATNDDKDETYQIEVRVPGKDGVKMHDEVILMVDGSYSMDNEWPAMKDAINAIGKTVLNGTGTTQLTLMAFGMGDNEVLVHVKDADELAAALGALPGNLLYGRSSTNCEAGFDGVANYIKNHDETLNDVQVIFISDGNLNTDETPRAFDANWQKWSTKYGAATVAMAAFENGLRYGEYDRYGNLLSVYYAPNLPDAFYDVFGNRFDDAATREEILERAFVNGEVTNAEFMAYAEQLWTDVYAYSGLVRGVEYPVSVVERAFVKYDKEHGTYIQDLFYYTTYKSSYVTYDNRWTRTPAAADKLAAMDAVKALYVVDYDGYSAWMDTGITSDKATFIQSEGIAGLCEALKGVLTDLSKTPFNDVVVTDYMSKWVNLDPTSICIRDNSTGKIIWTINGGWAAGAKKPTTKNPPVVVDLVAPMDYEDGGDDVVGNTSGDIYKLTWYVKDGAMLRSDSYSLLYDVTIDTEESGYVDGEKYPANGYTYLDYKDENGEEHLTLIKVPEIYSDFFTTPEPNPRPRPKPEPTPDPKPEETNPDEIPPLVIIPDEEPPLVEIPEETPPLAEVPKTGDASALWMVLSALSGSGLIGIHLLERKKREDEEK